MKTIAQKCLLVFLTCGVAYSQDDFRQEIAKAYQAAFSAMRLIKTKGEIRAMVDAMDVPEWQGTFLQVRS